MSSEEEPKWFMDPKLLGAAIGLGLIYVLFMRGKKTNTYVAEEGDELSDYTDGGVMYDDKPVSERPIRLAKKGVAAHAAITVCEQIARAAKRHGSDIAMRQERVNAATGEHEWVEWTWAEYYEQARCAAKAFIKLGLQPQDSVNIIGFNSPEWLIADIGAILAGGLAAGIYSTNSAEACAYVSKHSGGRVAVVEDEKQLAKFEEIAGDMDKLEAIVVYSHKYVSENRTDESPGIYSWAEFMAEGADEGEGDDATDWPSNELEVRIDAQNASDCCTLIYTSGTTGNPKAVMCSHDNVTWTGLSLLSQSQKDCKWGETAGGEHIVSYLPLSHIAAQMIDIHVPMHWAASSKYCGTTHFARRTALKGTLGDTLRAVKPTLFFGVPRVWQKINEKIVATSKATPKSAVAQAIVDFAKSRGKAYFTASQTTGSGCKPWGYFLADKLVFSKVRAKLGLDRVKSCATGAAPTARTTFEFFGMLGITIQEVYGMSESSGPQTFNVPSHFRIGTTGACIKGVEIKIDHVDGRDADEEGEICFRGRHIMIGYMGNERKTQEAIDAEGWLHSGDIGKVDSVDSCLSITGRIKELLITHGGENIAPVPIEQAIKAKAPCISNIVMIGDKKKYCTALVTLHHTPNEDATGFLDELCGASAEIADTFDSDAIRAAIQSSIDAYNKIATSSACKIQKFIVLPGDFSQHDSEENGEAELGPTLKLKRPVITGRGGKPGKYQAEIDSMYTGRKK